jgi:hypothetical protein
MASAVQSQVRPVVSWPHASEKAACEALARCVCNRILGVEHPRVPSETRHGAMPLHGIQQSPAARQSHAQLKTEDSAPPASSADARFSPAYGLLQTRTPSRPCHSADHGFMVLQLNGMRSRNAPEC